MQHFPALTRELVAQEFPLVISAEIAIPDQSKIMRSYQATSFSVCRRHRETSMVVSRSMSRHRSPRNKN